MVTITAMTTTTMRTMTTTTNRIAVLAAAAAVVLAGCTADAEDRTDGVSVVVTLPALEHLATQITGDDGEVINVVPDGADPHGTELAPTDVNAMAGADVVIYLSGIQPATDEAVGMLEDVTIVDMSEVAGASIDEDTQVLAPPEPGTDPHFWLDPPRLAQAGRQVADALASVDPQDADGYQQRATELTADLDELDDRFRTELAPCQGDTLVVTHEAFGYLTARYGLEQVGIAGVDPEVEPSPARLREVGEVVRQADVQTIFFEARASSGVAERLADELGVQTGVLDPMERSAGADYLDVMDTNLAALRAGLVCAG